MASACYENEQPSSPAQHPPALTGERLHGGNSLMVEYSLAKAGVEGSSPFFRLQNCVLWSALQIVVQGYPQYQKSLNKQVGFCIIRTIRTICTRTWFLVLGFRI